MRPQDHIPMVISKECDQQQNCLRKYKMSCKCQSCDEQYKVDLSIPDEIWDKIKPTDKPEGAGLLCGSCIMKRIENLDIYDHYLLRR